MLSRHDSEDDQEPEKQQHLHSKTVSPTPVEGHGDNAESTKTEEPNTSQLGPTECKHHKDETKSACSLLLKAPFIHNSSVFSSQWQTAKSGMYLRELSCFCPK